MVGRDQIYIEAAADFFMLLHCNYYLIWPLTFFSGWLVELFWSFHDFFS